jgi:hypothetical protein
MKEIIKQYGETLAEAIGGILLIGLIGTVFFGGGLAGIAKIFSAWLYG